MKLIHTADWHLGRIFYETYLTEEQEYVLDQFLELVQREKPDAVIIAGDLYDRAVPPVAAVTLLDKVLQRLAEWQVPVIAISGNHDSTERIAFGSKLMRQGGIYLYGMAIPQEEPLVLHDEWGAVYICPMAFAEPAYARIAFADPEIRQYADVFRAQVKAFTDQIPQGSRMIAIAHGFIAGGMESDSERPLSVGTTTQVPWEVFSPFHYTMLGHLHRPQWVGETMTVRYSGSLLKYSFNEAEQNKGIDIVEMDATGQCRTRTVSLVPRRDVRIMEGTMEELLSDAIPASEDYLMVRLTDPSPVLHAMGRLRKKFPQVLALQATGMVRPAETRKAADLRKVSREEIFADFIATLSGTPMSEDEQAVMHEVWEELQKEEAE